MGGGYDPALIRSRFTALELVIIFADPSSHCEDLLSRRLVPLLGGLPSERVDVVFMVQRPTCVLVAGPDSSCMRKRLCTRLWKRIRIHREGFMERVKALELELKKPGGCNGKLCPQVPVPEELCSLAVCKGEAREVILARDKHVKHGELGSSHL